jgi:prefoldin subunit 5
MKFCALMLVVLLANGCGSVHCKSEKLHGIAEKRQEVEVLVTEMGLLGRSLEELQREIGATGTDYAGAQEEQDLDRAIAVLRHAQDKLSSQQARLRKHYSIGNGPY